MSQPIIEKQLLEKIREHDGEAEAELIQTYGPLIFRASRPYLNDHSEAAESTETFLAEFIFKVQANLKEDTFLDDLEEYLKYLRDTKPNPAGLGLSKRQLKDLLLFNSLPLLERIVVELSLFNKMADEDIAERLACPVDFIKKVGSEFLRTKAKATVNRTVGEDHGKKTMEHNRTGRFQTHRAKPSVRPGFDRGKDRSKTRYDQSSPAHQRSSPGHRPISGQRSSSADRRSSPKQATRETSYPRRSSSNQSANSRTTGRKGDIQRRKRIEPRREHD